ncbi:MAG: Cof-type HAD-IIB family hydrolase [Actinomycetota bacterium]
MAERSIDDPVGAEPPVRMIATDIDGTMIRSDGSLAPRVKRALHDAVDAGIHVVPATGRPVIVAEDVIAAAELPSYWVFANGAITRHLGRDELIRGFWIDRELTGRLIALIRRRLPAAGVAVEFETTVAFEHGFERVVPVVPGVPATDDVLGTLADGAPEHRRIQKVLVFDLSVDIDELFREVSEVVEDTAVVSYSGLPFVELAASQVTKATALELLVADLGLTAAEVASFGDNHNDVSMLTWSGRSYAMANATDDAKEAAGEVIATNDEDGLAIKVEELLAGR